MERLNPPDVYEPYRGVYTQVIRSTPKARIDVAGTVSLGVGRTFVGEGDMAAQARQIMENIGRSLRSVGAGFDDVVRLNVFTLDVDAFLEHGGPAVGEYLGDVKPVSTLVGVTRLADPRYLLEIEAVAVLE